MLVTVAPLYQHRISSLSRSVGTSTQSFGSPTEDMFTTVLNT